MKKRPMVLVTWTDATRSADQVSKSDKPALCRTVGYLLADTDTKVVVAMDQNKADGHRIGLTIPKAMVVSIESLVLLQRG